MARLKALLLADVYNLDLAVNLFTCERVIEVSGDHVTRDLKHTVAELCALLGSVGEALTDLELPIAGEAGPRETLDP